MGGCPRVEPSKTVPEPTEIHFLLEEVTDIHHFDEVKGYGGFNNTAASVRWCSPPQPHLQTWLLWYGSETLVLILTLTLAPKVILARLYLPSEP